MAEFGELLQRLRGSRAQKEVAADLGMPVTTLSSLERQRSVPRGPVLKRLADYYGVKISYFYAAATSELKSTEPAKEWLRLVSKQISDVNSAIATHASPDLPESVKEKIKEAIIRQKHAENPNDE